MEVFIHVYKTGFYEDYRQHNIFWNVILPLKACRC